MTLREEALVARCAWCSGVKGGNIFHPITKGSLGDCWAFCISRGRLFRVPVKEQTWLPTSSLGLRFESERRFYTVRTVTV